MKKLTQINDIPIEYLQSIFKIDINSPSGLTWLPRNDSHWNGRHANQKVGSIATNKKDNYKFWKTGILYNNKCHYIRLSKIILLLYQGYLTEDKIIDHIDGNSLNNNVNNLREVDAAQNSQNRKLSCRNKSGTKGVQYFKNGWVVSIAFNNKRYYLGYYKDKQKAIQAEKEARIKLHGKYAKE